MRPLTFTQYDLIQNLGHGQIVGDRNSVIMAFLGNPTGPGVICDSSGFNHSARFNPPIDRHVFIPSMGRVGWDFSGTRTAYTPQLWKIPETGGISLWFMSHTPYGSGNSHPLFRAQAAGPKLFDGMFWSDNNYYFGWYNGGGRVSGATASLGLVAGKWHHICMRWGYVSTAMPTTFYSDLWIDGNYIGYANDDTHYWDTTTASTMTWGTYDVGVAGFPGIISDIIMFSGVLSNDAVWMLSRPGFDIVRPHRRLLFPGIAAAPPVGNRRRRVLITARRG